MSDELSLEEQQELAKFLAPGSAVQDEKHNVHKFLHDVAISDDTTKTGFLTKEELGIPKLPVRTHKELALFCREIANMDYFADYFEKEAEIITSTSLSKDAKLLNLAVISKRQLEDVTKQPKKENRGWFGGKNRKGGEE